MHIDAPLGLPDPARRGAQVRVLVLETHGVHGERGRGAGAPHLPVQRAVDLGSPGESRGLAVRGPARQ